MPKWSAELIHLACGHDTISFISFNVNLNKKIMQVLKEYELESDQKINMDNSFYYVHKNTLTSMLMQVEQDTIISRGCFPLRYPGCPLFYSMRNKYQYS